MYPLLVVFLLYLTLFVWDFVARGGTQNARGIGFCKINRIVIAISLALSSKSIGMSSRT